MNLKQTIVPIILTLLIFMNVNISYALPVCCKNFTTNNGTLFESLDALGPTWAQVGTGGTVFLDTTHVVQGTASIQIDSSTTAGLIARNNTAITLQSPKNLIFWFWVENRSAVGNIEIQLSNDTAITKFFDLKITGGHLRNGWNPMVFDIYQFTQNGVVNWTDTFVKLIISVHAATNGQFANISFDNFGYNYAGRPKLMFHFDDGYSSVYKNATPIMNLNHQRGVVYSVVNDIGSSSNFMTLSNLTDLANLGWDISSHTISHPDLTDSPNLDIELNGSYNYFLTNGFAKSAPYLSYPFGLFNSTVINATKLTYVTGRTVINSSNEIEPSTFDDICYTLKIIDAQNTTSESTLTNAINMTINQSGVLMLLFHQIVNGSDNNNAIDYNLSSFQNISNYAASRSSDIDFVTMSDINTYTDIYFSKNNSQLIVNNISADGTVNYTNGATYKANATIIPVSDNLNVTISTWNTSGDFLKNISESSTNKTTGFYATYTIGDNAPNSNSTVQIFFANNGTKFQDFFIISNGTGYISFNTTGYENDRYMLIQNSPNLPSPYIVEAIAATVIIGGVVYILRRFVIKTQ